MNQTGWRQVLRVTPGAVVFRLLGGGAVLAGSFFGTLALLDYRAETTAEVTNQAAANGSIIAIDPASLRECDAPRTANVTWNVAASGVQAVKIFVRNRKGEERLFVAGGAAGTARTAAWAVAGTKFIIKDANTLKAIIDGAIGLNRC